jgi:hypothetical protein
MGRNGALNCKVFETAYVYLQQQMSVRPANESHNLCANAVTESPKERFHSRLIVLILSVFSFNDSPSNSDLYYIGRLDVSE